MTQEPDSGAAGNCFFENTADEPEYKNRRKLLRFLYFTYGQVLGTTAQFTHGTLACVFPVILHKNPCL